MNSEVKKKSNFREILKFLSTIVSWTVFTLLMLVMAALVYYFIAVRIYAAKGSGHEPKFSLYTIITPSMTPNINVYDVVIDVKVDKPEDIKINDVITFNSSIPGVHGGTITHRVIAVSKDADGNYHYRTKGDFNLVDDGVDVDFNSIVGKVALRIPQLGRAQAFLATKAGWLICVLVPALYVIIKDILKIIRLKSNNSNGKFSKFLNRPLISFKKRKLLPYTPKEESTDHPIISKEEIPKQIIIPQEEAKEKTIVPQNEVQDQPVILKEETDKIFIPETKTQIMNFYDDEDEEDFDLPSLK